MKVIDAVLHRLLDAFKKNLQPMAAIPGAMAVFEESLRLYERCVSKF